MTTHLTYFFIKYYIGSDTYILQEITNVKIILSSILHITNIKFTTAKNDAVEVKDERPLVFGKQDSLCAVHCKTNSPRPDTNCRPISKRIIFAIRMECIV